MPDEPARRRPPDLVLTGDAAVPTRVRVASGLEPVTDARGAGVEPGRPPKKVRLRPVRSPGRVRPPPAPTPDAVAIKRVRVAMPR